MLQEACFQDFSLLMRYTTRLLTFCERDSPTFDLDWACRLVSSELVLEFERR